MKNICGVKIYTGSITRRQNLHGHKDTERNKIHGIEIHGAESAHRMLLWHTNQLILFIYLNPGLSCINWSIISAIVAYKLLIET